MSGLMRLALLATAVMNVFGALLFVPSFSGLREFLGLPNASHGLYLWIIASWIFLFGVCYLWLGITGRRERLFLAIGATGKLSFVVLMFAYYLAGEIPLTTALASLSDLFFAAIFAFYLWKTRTV